jgi:hypothetical protein
LSVNFCNKILQETRINLLINVSFCHQLWRKFRANAMQTLTWHTAVLGDESSYIGIHCSITTLIIRLIQSVTL